MTPGIKALGLPQAENGFASKQNRILSAHPLQEASSSLLHLP
jgi:hypothetical protein